jgi:hypothetical protein
MKETEQKEEDKQPSRKPFEPVQQQHLPPLFQLHQVYGLINPM